MRTLPVFEVAPEVFERWPTYIVGCVIARGIGSNGGRIAEALAAAEAEVVERFSGRDPKDDSAIAVWRAAFSQSGWTPSKYPASVEALVKRVAKGQALPRINPVVDLANSAVLRCLVPIGAHDIGTFGGSPLTVRLPHGGDQFLPMGDAEAEQPEPDEIVYAVGTDVRTRRWVWRQSRTALVGEDARDVFFPVDGFADSTAENVSRAIELIAELASSALGADVATGLVTADQRSF